MGVALTSAQRQALRADGHRLTARVTVSAERLDDGVIEHIRASLAAAPLLKVRLQAEDRAQCDAAARELGRRVPCEVVKRIGRVVLLYRDTGAADQTKSAGDEAGG
jgi:RNA-binding protein YhbY